MADPRSPPLDAIVQLRRHRTSSFPVAALKGNTVDALSVPNASFLNLLYLGSDGVGGVGWGWEAAKSASCPRPQKLKKNGLDRVKTREEMGKDLQNLTNMTIYLPVFRFWQL